MLKDRMVWAALPNGAANALIDSLPRKERGRVLDACQPVSLTIGRVLCHGEEAFTHAYFPLTGAVSLVARVSGRQPLGMGLIGSEGMLGATLALGVKDAPVRAVVRGSGCALRMSASQFQRDLNRLPALRRTIQRYIYVLMSQLSQMVACGRFHEVEQRLARWILMTHDRIEGENLYFTHALLAEMLGVQRSAVSIAAGTLQARGIIRYSRGRISILTRSGLEAVSCDCYATMIDTYERVLALSASSCPVRAVDPERPGATS
jgi:CRP-like cAMP-binding protein